MTGRTTPPKKWRDGQPAEDGKKQETRDRAREQRVRPEARGFSQRFQNGRFARQAATCNSIASENSWENSGMSAWREQG